MSEIKNNSASSETPSAESKKNFLKTIFQDNNKMRLAWFWILLLLICTLCFYFSFVASALFFPKDDLNYITATDWEKEHEQDRAFWNDEDGVKVILLLGCDKREAEKESGRSDTIMLACLRESDKQLLLVSIPRDTYVTIPNTGRQTKINHAYSYGGIPLTKQTIEELLDLNIDNYAEIEFEGFKNLVDAIGGIDMDVEKPMYNALEQIDLKSGFQHLKGEEALAYVRYRDKESADIGRVERQQKFMLTLGESLLDNLSITNLPRLFSVAKNNMNTDLSTKDLTALANTFKGVSMSNIKTVMLAGTPEYYNHVSYWVCSDENIDELKEQIYGVINAKNSSTTNTTSTTNN